jgi:hypothetical protein
VKRRLGVRLVVALSLLGCNSKPPLVNPVKAPTGDPVQLLTGAMPFDADECASSYPPVVLLADAEYGTQAAAYGMFGNDTTRAPVMWPPGFTAVRVGAEVAVVDPNGNLVAITGQSYQLSGNALIEDPNRSWPNRDDTKFRRGWVNSLIGPDMFYACGDATSKPTTAPMTMF